MAYEPHTWATGETITADKLNNIDMALRRASSCIQAHHLGTQTIGANTQFTVYLDDTRYIQGGGFKLGSQHEIICNYAGIVVVSARVYCMNNFAAGDQFILSIGKNSDIVEHTCHVLHGEGGETIVAKTCLVEVAAGDVIKLKGQNTTGARGTIGSTAGTHANCVTAYYLA